MVLRMSISSVPGINSVFFASLPIDYLPIDKIWEKVFQGAAAVKARADIDFKCLLPRQPAQALQDLRKPDWRLYVRSSRNCRGPRPCATWSRKSSILAFEALFVFFVMRLALRQARASWGGLACPFFD